MWKLKTNWKVNSKQSIEKGREKDEAMDKCYQKKAVMGTL